MGFILNADLYMDYILRAAKIIAENKEYVTALDAVTGDGDHWANLNAGFECLVSEAAKLRQMPLDAAFMRIGMLMMSKVGGSSGVLYGGAYMEAGKQLGGKAEMNREELGKVLKAMLEDMMQRGGAKPGYKTMIDSLYPSVIAYEDSLQKNLDDRELLKKVKKAAQDGAEATGSMEAVKGRASYRTDKGVGHLDPGAVTMSYQIGALCDFILEKLIDKQQE